MLAAWSGVKTTGASDHKILGPLALAGRTKDESNTKPRTKARRIGMDVFIIVEVDPERAPYTTPYLLLTAASITFIVSDQLPSSMPVLLPLIFQLHSVAAYSFSTAALRVAGESLASSIHRLTWPLGGTGLA